jgi:hypothetical protein
MNIKNFMIELRTAHLLPMIVEGQLAMEEESLKAAPVDLISTLTQHRLEIKSLLIQNEENGATPHIDENYDMGVQGKGCLVVPANCKNRYKYWRIKTSFVLLESDDWLERYKKNDNTVKIKWEPMSLVEILQELGVSEEFMGRYSKGASLSV